MTHIMGHRGAQLERPENTIMAYRQADALGAYGIEMDVYLLPDRSLVIHHDRVVGDEKRDIYLMTGKEVTEVLCKKEYNGVWYEDSIPYFSEFLNYMKTNQMFFNVEIKSESGFLSEVGDCVMEALEESGLRDRTIISSFSHNLLQDIHQKYPLYQLGILYSDSHGIDVVSYCLRYGFNAIHPHFSEVTRELVDRCHENGLLVNTWTVNDEQDILKMIEYGVDNIITNDVRTGLRLLKESRTVY